MRRTGPSGHSDDMTVAGVDGCRRGWIAITLDAGGGARGFFVAQLDELVDAIPDLAAVAIDIPIGLPTAGRRRADDMARDRLGPRRNSVFYAPVRQAVTATTHAEANAICRRVTGQGISRQSFALAPKILEAERWVTSAGMPVWEVHPEVSFSLMLGRPARHPKRSWAGLHERMNALRDAGVDVGDVGSAGAQAGADDVLDAAAAAWSAVRLRRGEGISMPDPPEEVPGSMQPMAIWA